MTSIIDTLCSEQEWENFYISRCESNHLNFKEKASLRSLIDSKILITTSIGINNGTYKFSLPTLSKISKGNSHKKRIIYQYQEHEMWILKFLVQKMHLYDSMLAPCCYSFRKYINARTAINDVLSIPSIDSMYCLKSDISDYFNSIPVDSLCESIKETTADDPKLTSFLIELLKVDKAISKDTNEIIIGPRGAMAGTPISPFLANLYLTDVDFFFQNRNAYYYRYADDILLFAESLEKINELKSLLLKKILQKGLKINDDKFKLTLPNCPFEYLGINYNNGVIDISENTKNKIKAKIRRKARALRRWRLKKDASFEQTAHVLIRVFNRKFYDINETGDFCWAKWFFTLINTSAGLSEIDDYLVMYIRYLYSGRHFKGNYKITYEKIKELGFRSLVNEYYKR